MTRILRRPPAFLFRYRPPTEVSAGYLEGLLSRDQIYASPPRGFSDWYDCRAQIAFDGTKKELLRHWTYWFKRFGLKGRSLSRAVSEAAHAWKEADKDTVVQGIQASLDNSGVICLTDTPLDNRMWEEYAGCHQGICLCFESFESPFSTAFSVNYMPLHPTVRFNAGGEEQVEAFLLTKLLPYSWEREWRQVYYNSSGGLKSIASSSLRAIILGARVEAITREKVATLLALWKPKVALLAVDITAAGLRLVPVSGHPTPHTIPPIQERSPDEPEGPSDAVRLRDALASVSSLHRLPDIDGRLEQLLATLDGIIETGGRATKETLAGLPARIREACDLLRTIVDRSGSASPGYGYVAVLLYRIVRAVELGTGLQF
jgi:hypothetical protein